MRPLVMLSREQKLAEIKRLYYQTTKITIQEDFAKAIDLVKSMTGEEERERAAVYMDGLAQMRSDWAKTRGWQGKKSKNTGRAEGKNEKGKTNRAR